MSILTLGSVALFTACLSVAPTFQLEFLSPASLKGRKLGPSGSDTHLIIGSAFGFGLDHNTLFTGSNCRRARAAWGCIQPQQLRLELSEGRLIATNMGSDLTSSPIIGYKSSIDSPAARLKPGVATEVHVGTQIAFFGSRTDTTPFLLLRCSLPNSEDDPTDWEYLSAFERTTEEALQDVAAWLLEANELIKVPKDYPEDDKLDQYSKDKHLPDSTRRAAQETIRRRAAREASRAARYVAAASRLPEAEAALHALAQARADAASVASEVSGALRAVETSGLSWSTRVRFSDGESAETALKNAWDEVKRLVATRVAHPPEELVNLEFSMLQAALDAEADAAAALAGREGVARRRKSDSKPADATDGATFVIVTAEDLGEYPIIDFQIVRTLVQPLLRQQPPR